MASIPSPPDQAYGKRVAMLIALPQGVWDRIREDARDLGVGPSKVIEPVLLQAFGCGRDVSP
jgi:hypothetical protein